MDNLDARIDRLDSAQRQMIRMSYHGIAARLDRLPQASWHRKIMLLLGGVVFCDCLDMYVGGGILAQLLESGCQPSI